METGHMEATWFLYSQFTPNVSSLVINYLNKWSFDLIIFQLRFTQNYCSMFMREKNDLSV